MTITRLVPSEMRLVVVARNSSGVQRPLKLITTTVAEIVGNEDGAYHVTATLFQALNDEGRTIPAGAANYWVGEAMHKTDFKELKEVPEAVARGAETLASNAAHLARLLKGEAYPGVPQET